MFWSSVRPGWPSAAGCSCSPTVQRSPAFVADLDCAGIAQGFLDEQFGDLRWLALGFEIDRFDESLDALPLVGLGETRHGAAERSDRSGFVVAVLSAESRRRDQERARLRDLLDTERAWLCKAI